MIRIQIFIFQLQFHENTGFGGVFFAPVTGCPGYVHSRLGAGISAVYAAGLDQGGVSALSGGGYGSAHAAHAASNNDYIIVFFYGSVLGCFRCFVNVLIHRLGLLYPFTAPAVSPETSCFPRNVNTNTIGIMASVAAAVRGPHSCPKNPR